MGIVIVINIFTAIIVGLMVATSHDDDLKALGIVATIELVISEWIVYGIIHFIIKFW